MRTKEVLTFAAGIVFLPACGWFVYAAGPERKFSQGLASLRANEPEKTRYCLVSIDRRADYHSQASLLRGWLRLQAHQADEAEEYMAIWADLTDALEVRRCRPLTLALRGRLLYEGGRLANALDVLNGALAEDPDEIEAHRWLGSALYDVGATLPALEHLRQVADREVTNARICRLLGLIYREHAAFREAIASYQQSLTRDPNQRDADEVRLDLARCQIAIEDYNAALTTLLDCQDNADVFALRGLCFASEGNRERAKQCVDQALQEDGENAVALGCLVKIDPSQAAERLSKAVQNKPDDYELREHLVQAYRALGNEPLAEQHERRLKTITKLREELGELLVQANQDLFDASLRYRIADLADRLGQPELAADWWKAARLLDRPPPDAASPLPSVVPPMMTQ